MSAKSATGCRANERGGLERAAMTAASGRRVRPGELASDFEIARAESVEPSGEPESGNRQGNVAAFCPICEMRIESGILHMIDAAESIRCNVRVAELSGGRGGLMERVLSLPVRLRLIQHLANFSSEG